MAIWQYKCCLIPAESLGVTTHATREMLDEELWEFQGLRLDDTLKSRMGSHLPPVVSWHKDLYIWGHDEGDRIDLWLENDVVQSVSCRFDCRVLSREFVGIVCTLAQHLKCRLVSQRYLDVLPTEPDSVLEMIMKSGNRKVLKDPRGILPKLADEVDQHD